MIRNIGPECAKYIAGHQQMYPQAMRETDPDDWAKILRATSYSVGDFNHPESTANFLIGWAIFDREADQHVYMYDLAVLPPFQGKGIGRRLVRCALKDTYRAGEIVHYHARHTSYPLLSDATLLKECGYTINTDILIPDHYFNEYGIHEDAHELFIAPVG